MSIGMERYVAIILEWKKLYGVPERGPFRFDPTEARLCCFRCEKKKDKMSRHHTANDFFFAQMLPQFFAKRYVEFRREDTEKLCDACHKLAHRLYKPITAQVWSELNRGGQRVITREWCEKWMGVYRMAFYAWIKDHPYKKRKRKRHRNRNKSGLPTKREV